MICQLYIRLLTYLVNFSPEAVFEAFLCFAECLVVLKSVQMCEDAHDSREAMNLANVQELKGLHFKAKTGIYQHQNLIKSKYQYCLTGKRYIKT